MTGAVGLGPRNPLEFGRDNLFSTVMGTTPQWVVNREQGPVQATLLSSAAACVAAIAKIRLGNMMPLLSPFMHGVLGLPVGFMLVFRWNNAYERWWQGRTELGLLLMHARNLGGQICTWVAPEDQQLATRALALICALKECVADRLNGTVLRDGTVMLNATTLSTPLHPEDLEGLFAAENKVLFCIEQLRTCIYAAWKQDLLPPPVLGGMLNEDLFGVVEAYGECEKVVNQPPPGCIITHLKSTLMVYVCTLPFILVHEVGVFAVVPTTALLSLALFGTEAAAEQIEQPFGNREYHLPVRGLIINNTRDMGQTSRPVLGFAGYVNSPRDFSDFAKDPVGAFAEAMDGSASDASDAASALNPSLPAAPSPAAPLLFGAADAWERGPDASEPAMASPSGVAATRDAMNGGGGNGGGGIPAWDRDGGGDGKASSSEGSEAGGGGGNGNAASGSGGNAADRPPGVISLPSAVFGQGFNPNENPGVVEMAAEAERTLASPMSGASSEKSAGKSAGFAPYDRSSAATTTPRTGTKAGGSDAVPGGAASYSRPYKMPTWKAQTPIEVFDENSIEIDAVSGAERLSVSKLHKYHVGDSKRRRSIDARSAAAGFRDDSVLPSKSHASSSVVYEPAKSFASSLFGERSPDHRGAGGSGGSGSGSGAGAPGSPGRPPPPERTRGAFDRWHQSTSTGVGGGGSSRGGAGASSSSSSGGGGGHQGSPTLRRTTSTDDFFSYGSYSSSAWGSPPPSPARARAPASERRGGGGGGGGGIDRGHRRGRGVAVEAGEPRVRGEQRRRDDRDEERTRREREGGGRGARVVLGGESGRSAGRRRDAARDGTRRVTTGIFFPLLGLPFWSSAFGKCSSRAALVSSRRASWQQIPAHRRPRQLKRSTRG